MTGDHIALAVTVLLALFACYSIFNNLLKARLIEDTPTSKIRSASQGYVELSGFARPHLAGTIVAPLTGRPCLWYHYKIECYAGDSKSSSWRLVDSKSSNEFFSLRDETGECAIDPRRADISTSRIKIWRGQNRHPVAASNLSTMIRNVFEGSGSDGDYRYTEKIIEDGDYLYTLGLFQSIHAPPVDQQQKQKTIEILNQWKQDYDQLVDRFDTDSSGDLDLEEWEHARHQAGREAREYVLKNYDDTPIHVLTHSPQRRHPFLISNRDPRLLARKYRLQAAAMVALFLLTLGACVYLGLQLMNSALR